jgi:hypothetical protein
MLSSQIRVALLTTAGMFARLFAESSFDRVKRGMVIAMKRGECSDGVEARTRCIVEL